MKNKLKHHFPLIHDREELLQTIQKNEKLRKTFNGWEEERQKEFLDFCTGVKGIKICLDKFRSQTVYLVIGMLIGSLYSIMMGPVTLDMQNKIEWMSPARFNWWCLVGGALLIGVLEAFKFVKVKKEDETVSE